jgi:hypothetical protein
MESLDDLRKQMIQDPKEKYQHEPSISNATSVSNLEDIYPGDPYLGKGHHAEPTRKNNYFNAEHEYRFNTDLIVDSKNENFRDSVRNLSSGPKSPSSPLGRDLPDLNAKKIYVPQRNTLEYRIGKISQEFLISESATIQSDNDKYVESSESIVLIKNKIKGFYSDSRDFEREI